MQEKGKISALQMGLLMYPTILATAVLLVPALTMERAGRDMWMSPIWASFIGFFTVYIASKLNNLYPQETVIQYSGRILGVIAGKIFGLLYIFFYLHVTGVVIREYSEFVVGSFFSRTPIVVVAATMILVCALAVRAGVEVLGRLAEILVPILILLLVFVMVLLFPDFKMERMYPVMENGIMPSILGSLTPQVWFSQYFFMSFFFPFLSDRENGMKWGMISVFAVMLTLFLSNITVLFVFGDTASRLVYPLMSASRYISIADFLEHLESIVMAIWVTGTFLKICVFYYSLALGTAQWLNLSSYRPVILPMGILLGLFTFWVAPNVSEMAQFIATTAWSYWITVHVVLPLILLLVAYIRKGGRKNKGGEL